VMRLGSTSLARMLRETSIAEDDRLALRWQDEYGARPRKRHHRGGEREQEDERRHVAPESLAGPYRILDEPQARVMHGVALLAPQRVAVRATRPARQEQPQRIGPEKPHTVTYHAAAPAGGSCAAQGNSTALTQLGEPTAFTCLGESAPRCRRREYPV
jgi:hypothetical protein